MTDLAQHTVAINIDCKKFLIFKNLKVMLELDNGQVLGRRASWA